MNESSEVLKGVEPKFKKNLNNLDQLLLGQDQVVYNFARYIAEEANPKLQKNDFNDVLGVQLREMEYLFKYGKKLPFNGYNGESYKILKDLIPTINKTVYPNDDIAGLIAETSRINIEELGL